MKKYHLTYGEHWVSQYNDKPGEKKNRVPPKRGEECFNENWAGIKNNNNKNRGGQLGAKKNGHSGLGQGPGVGGEQRCRATPGC